MDALDCGILRVSETVWAESGPGEADDVQLAPVDGDIDRRFGLPGPELLHVPEMVTVIFLSVFVVLWTDECVVAGFYVAVVCFVLPDSCDLMGALDHPFGVPLLDSTSVTHPTDILVRLEETDTVMAHGSPRLAHPIIPHDRLREMWRTSVLESDSPDFIDTGDPELCLGMPGPRGCVWTAELVCDTALLGLGVSSQTLMSRDFLQGFDPVSPALPVRRNYRFVKITGWGGFAGSGGLGLYKDGSWERIATSRSTGDWVTSLWVCCMSCDWEHLRSFCAPCWWCSMPSGMDLPAVDQVGVASTAVNPLPGTFRGFDLDLQSDLDSDILDVIGLRAIQPDTAVIKVMSIPDNCCIRVVILDDHLGTEGFHEILIHDMEEEYPPFVALSDLGCLRLDWPRAIF